MPENLLTPSNLKLIGRIMLDIFIGNAAALTQGAQNALAAAEAVLAANPRATAEDVLTALSAHYKGQAAGSDQRRAAEDMYFIAKAAPHLSATTASDVLEVVRQRNASAYQNAYSTLGDNSFLKKQLQADGARLARIYGFTYEGQYSTLPVPSLFLVHGPGQPVANQSRISMETAGVAAREWEFSGPYSNRLIDLRRWDYDKADFSIRFDVDSGPFEQILLAMILGGGSSMSANHNLGAHNLSVHNLGIGSTDPRNRR
jgi:hypothetical protein